MKRYVLSLLLLLASCNSSESPADKEKGRAEITSFAEGGQIEGTVDFVEVAEGLRIYASIQGLSPGKHGFHVHEFGDLGASGKAAGGHYNPDSVKHGYIVKDGFEKAHPGDFGNLDADKDGNAEMEILVPCLGLNGGEYNIAGRAVIIHADEDDFRQPTGNAGARVAGGIIKITK